ncbi:Gfo/Idh/MocA family oxidoreductase [Thermodesulfobacteriota bacterium]
MRGGLDTVRVAVVGMGYLGNIHAQKYAAMDGVELVAVVDSDRQRAEAASRRYGTTAYASHRDILGLVDAVSVVVPTPVHFSVSWDFLEANVDVLIEKPMTTTLQEADALINSAQKRDLIIQVGHLERFNPAVVALQGVVKSPLFIESHRLSVFKDRCTDVSVVLDLMIHDLDIILNLVPSKIKDIRAVGASVISPHVDIANARIEFENGCVANVTASRVSLKNQRKIRMFQKDGYIAVDFGERNITVIRRGTGPGGVIPGMEITQEHFEEGDALEAELAAFIRCIQTRETPEVSGKVGRDALRTALIVMEEIGKASAHVQKNLGLSLSRPA